MGVDIQAVMILTSFSVVTPLQMEWTTTKIYVLSAENLSLLLLDSKWVGSSGIPSVSHGKIRS